MDGSATVARTVLNADAAATNGNVTTIANAGGVASPAVATREPAATACPARSSC